MKLAKYINTKNFSERQTIGTLIVIYLILRLINLTKLPIFNDEAIYLDWGWKELNTPNNLFFSLFDSKQPLLMWIIGFSQKIFSDPLFAGRIISVLAGLATMIGLYFLSKTIFGKKVAIISSLFYILIPLFSFFDRQALMETSIAAIGIWSLYFLIQTLKTKKLLFATLLGLILGIGFFIKTTALVFIISTLIVFAAHIFKNFKDKEIHIKNLLVSQAVSLLVLIPLFTQSMFWETLSANDRYTLTFSELAHFPVKTWFSNLWNAIDIIFWQITPLIAFFGVMGAVRSSRKKRVDQLIVLFWLLFGMAFVILTAKGIGSRYILPFLPLISIFSALAFTQLLNRKIIVGALITVVALIPAVVLNLTLMFSPVKYFDTLAKFTNQSQKGGYISSWTSGYGINETVDYLKKQAKNKRTVASVRLDAGNPESAIFAYFNGSRQIIPTYLDSRMFGEQLAEVDCLEASIPVYFVSRDIQMAGLNKYFEEVERFYKPEGENFIGIHKLKEDCEGKTLKLL